ncbi:hypothetical protein [Sphingomonas oryzagri]
MYELAFAKRGLTAAGTVTAGAAAVYASSQIVAYQNDTWKNVAAGAVNNALLGAASGCAAGFVGGLVVASIPGCGVSALFGALAGGFGGAIGGYMKVDTDGKLQVQIADSQALADMIGDAVVKAQQENQTVQTVTTDVGVNLTSSGIYQMTDSGMFFSAYSKFGTMRQFACKPIGSAGPDGSHGGAQACIFVPLAKSGSYFYGSNGQVADYYHHTVTIPLISLQSDCTGVTYDNCFSYTGLIAEQTSSTAVQLITGKQYTDASSVPSRSFKALPNLPAWANLLSTKLDANTAALKLSNEALAAILNASHAHMPAKSGVPAYDPNNPITPSEVQSMFDQNPDLIRPTLGDLARPWSTPGQDAAGTSSASKVAPPQPVQVVGSGAGTSTNNVTVNAKVDLGDPGADTMPEVDTSKPFAALDTLTSALDPWKKLSLSWPQPVCPAVNLDLRGYFGRYVGESALLHEDHWCQWLDPNTTFGADARSLIAVAMILGTTLLMTARFMEA